jgi:hypothetical protein
MVYTTSMKTIKEINVDVPELNATVIRLSETKYLDENLAILVHLRYQDDGQEESLPLSVNIPAQSFSLDDGEFFLKNYSEIAPIAEALLNSGHIVKTGGVGKTNYVTLPIVTVNFEDEENDT